MKKQWEFMSEICEHVLGLLSVEGMKIGYLHRFGVMVSSPLGNTRFQDIRDAVVLLSLLAQVDYGGFEFVARNYCDLDVHQGLLNSEWETPFSPERILLLIGESNLNRSCREWDAPDFLKLLSDLDAPPTPGFSDAIVSIMRSSTRKIEEFQVLIALEIVSGSSYDSELQFDALLSLHTNYRSWCFPLNLGQQTPNLKCHIAIDSIDLAMRSVGVALEQRTQVVKLLASSGDLTLARLEITGMDGVNGVRMDMAQIPWFEKFTRQIFCGVEQPPVDDVAILFQDPHFHFFPRICSALAHATKVTKSELQVPFSSSNSTMNNWIWQCVAFAFFSSHARANSSISHVHLKYVRLDSDNVAAMAEVLAASDPISLVSNQQSTRNHEDDTNMGAMDTCEEVTVKKGATVSLMQMYRDEILSAASSCMLDNEVCGFLLSCFNGKAKVLIPGFGVCEADSSEVVKVESHVVSSTKNDCGGIKSLSFKFADEIVEENEVGSPPQISGLVAFVGACLTRLELRHG